MTPRFLSRLLPVLCLLTASLAAAQSRLSLVVSVPEQKLYVFNQAGEELTRYSVSTSKFGYGDTRGSYSTPLGQLEIASKHGAGAVAGTVFKNCTRTGEVIPVNAPGRDPIVTRILWLRGKESQNASAYSRCIYIHGTSDEKNIGRKASYGCVRMRSRDIIALFETVEVGTSVEITMERVGGLFTKAKRPPAVIVSIPPSSPKKAAPAPAVSVAAAASSSSSKTPALSLSDSLLGMTTADLKASEPKTAAAREKTAAPAKSRKSRS